MNSIRKSLLHFFLPVIFVVLISVFSSTVSGKQSVNEALMESILQTWGHSGGYYAEGTAVNTASALTYLQCRGILEQYIDDEWYYNVPYNELLALVDDHFTNHTDLMDYIGQYDYAPSYDPETGIVRWYSGGWGGPDAWIYTGYYEDSEQSGKYYIQGVFVSDVAEDKANLIYGFDYLDYSISENEKYSYYVVTGIELTVVANGDGYKISAYSKSENYCVDGAIYHTETEPDGSKIKLKYISVSVDTPAGIKVNIENSLTTFTHFDGQWMSLGEGFLFTVEKDDNVSGYTVNYICGTEKDVLTDILGNYHAIPSASFTISVTAEYNPVSLENQSTGVSVCSDDKNGFLLGLTLEAETLKSTSNSFTIVKNSLGVADDDFVAYDLSLVDSDGKTVQPNRTVTVSFPLPDGWDGTEAKVYYIDSKGNATELTVTFFAEDKTITFNTDHFSIYVLTRTGSTGIIDAENTEDSDEFSTSFMTSDEKTMHNIKNGNKAPTIIIIIAVIVIIAAAAAAVILVRKKNNR